MSRIRQLPRRDWRKTAKLRAQQLTEILRTPNGTQELWDAQAACLWEAYTENTLIAPLQVGGGKTHVSALLPIVCELERPLLILPAPLVKKTEREFEELREHWQIPRNFRIESFSILGHANHQKLLDNYQPDGIIVDEFHNFKSIKTAKPAACAIQFARYKIANPHVPIFCLDGTPTKDSILDFCFLIMLGLGEKAPIPLEWSVTEQWAGCIDAKVKAWDRPDFEILADDLGEVSTAEDARKAFESRLNETPGIVTTSGSFKGTELYLEPVLCPPSAAAEQAFSDLRDLELGPDGWPFTDMKFQGWAAARSYGRDYYTCHDPWPPKEWLDARKGYAAVVRAILEDWDDPLTSEGQIRAAFLSGARVCDAWDVWAEIRPTFEVQRRTEYLAEDPAYLGVLANWADEGPGIIWTDHRAVSRKIQDKLGFTYYGEQGEDENGNAIEDAPANSVIVASREANGTGRNLQQWNRMFFTEPPPSGWHWEQNLGRQHRPHQKKDVHASYLVACLEDAQAVTKAIQEATYALQATSQEQKLLFAHHELIKGLPSGSAWQKPAKLRD